MNAHQDAAPVTELGEFLRSRRDRLTPEDVGVRSYGRRRVPGLRREELAQLAGVSVTYLTRLEQGQSQNASDAVIESLARALQLSADERTHLFTLARPSSAPAQRWREESAEVPELGAQRLLHAMEEVPAVLLGRFKDILAWNRSGHLLLASHLDEDAPANPESRPNQIRMLFLDEHTHDLYVNWEDEATLAVASMRYIAAQFADDRRLAELVGELSMKSPEFASLWAGHKVTLCTNGMKHFHHPEVGELELNYEVLHLPEGNGQRILTHTAEPGSSSYATLRLLTSV